MYFFRITDDDFITVNHEMGHIQYQRSYRNQSFLFRDGANPGFHEGIADILSLAVGNHQILPKSFLMTSFIWRYCLFIFTLFYESSLVTTLFIKVIIYHR